MGLTVLIVDDEELIRYGLREWLHEEGFNVLEAPDGATALELANEQPDIILLDFKLPDMDGLTVLKELTSRPGNPVIIMMTGYATIELAVDAMRSGAYHFITKPWDQEDLTGRLHAASELINLRISNEEHRANEIVNFSFDSIIGDSPVMRRVKTQAQKVAQTDATVLITGETGTGKEVFARAIHLASPRQGNEFIAVNCANIPETLLESELFGYEPGAFTDAKKRKIGRIERADKGTLFLDEIGDMPLHLQAKILRVLENREIERLGGEKTINVEVRVIAATHQDIKKLAEENKFREDLYYRLNVVPIEIPPVRERGDDAIQLAKHFIQAHNRLMNRNVRQIDPQAALLLKAYNWPGNVREVDNVIERIMILEDKETIEVKHLPEEIRSSTGSVVSTGKNGGFRPIALGLLEKEHILATLKFTNQHKKNAADLLGISRKTLKRKLDSWAKMSN
ncbi:sigma-54-dependent Fis family transcriptional regulator [bacterium]|nr:sigma-54-dependent Fis family transcriptional regulator [bacterium]